jgi:tRNA(adenine34) deaminase
VSTRLRRDPPLSDADWLGMEAALEEARIAALTGEVPVGAAIALEGAVIAQGHNQTVRLNDLTQHAEIIAIRRALASLHVDRLEGATLYVTLEPCAQCAGAIVLARVRRVLFGAYDPKAGMAGSVEDLLRHTRRSWELGAETAATLYFLSGAGGVVRSLLPAPRSPDTTGHQLSSCCWQH